MSVRHRCFFNPRQNLDFLQAHSETDPAGQGHNPRRHGQGKWLQQFQILHSSSFVGYGSPDQICRCAIQGFIQETRRAGFLTKPHKASPMSMDDSNNLIQSQQPSELGPPSSAGFSNISKPRKCKGSKPISNLSKITWQIGFSYCWQQ